MDDRPTTVVTPQPAATPTATRNTAEAVAMVQGVTTMA
jgi:hypothetical protein